MNVLFNRQTMLISEIENFVLYRSDVDIINKISTAIVRKHGRLLKDMERRDVCKRQIIGNCYACFMYNVLTQAVVFFL